MHLLSSNPEYLNCVKVDSGESKTRYLLNGLPGTLFTQIEDDLQIIIHISVEFSMKFNPESDPRSPFF